MNLPSEFISNIEGVFGEAGSQFLANIPALIEQASQRWSLTDVQPVPELSYNFVAFAKRAHLHRTAPPGTVRQDRCVLTDGVRKRSAAQVSTTPLRGSAQHEVVLKMGVPNSEMKSEIAALRLFNGEGACKLIDYDEEKYWMLLERLQPGVMLSTLEDDEEATHIAADVMQKIWKPLESGSLLPNNQQQAVGLHNFIKLSDWFDGLKRLRTMFNGGTGPLNEKLVDRVEGSVRDFFIENHKPVLMHGDFHHYNILSSERGWLVIDPKGVIGPACYEVGPLLLNPWDDLLSRKDYRGLTKRRIDILHERLRFERERIREWGLAHAVLSAWWSIEDNGDWHYAADFAEMIADLDTK